MLADILDHMILLSRLRRRFLAAALGMAALSGPLHGAEGFDLTAAQRARLQKFLPHALAKLEKKEPVHALVVGDSVTSMYVHTDDDSDTLKSYPGVFFGEIADQFYYTGGLRVERPVKGKRAKSLEVYGQEITLRNVSRGGRLMIHAMNVLAGETWDEKPDIILVSFGINDANAGHSLATYRRAVEDVVAAARKIGADLLLVGSTPTLSDPPEHGLSLTRPYVDTMREVAEAAGVFFADLGDIAWLVRVDEPMKGVERPPPEKPKEGEPVEPKAPSAIINFPMPEDLDPDPEKRAARLFGQVSTSLRKWFDHSGTVDLIHPNTALHRLLGRRLFAELIDGPRTTPWSMGVATAEFKDATNLEVCYRIQNLTEAPLRVNLLPLVTSHWKPKDAEAQVELKAGRKSLVTMTYTRTGGSPDATPPHEPCLRLPVMVLGGGVARIEDLRATLAPYTMLWNLGAQFNQEGGATVRGRIVNTTKEELAGKWQAKWMGQEFQGSFKADPKSEAPVTLHLKLPLEQTPATRQRGILSFTVEAGGLSLAFPRTIELAQNIGLKQAIPLFGPGQYPIDQPATPPAPGPDHPGVTFRVDVDSGALYCTWDIRGINLVDKPGGNAVTAELNIDARSYGKRLMPGVTEPLRVTADAADGPAAMGPIPSWAFGNGYDGNYDRKSAQAMLSSRPDGSRRLTLMLPRNLFMLHEWALGNGNSQIGLSTALTIWQQPDERNPQNNGTDYSLLDNGLHRDDAETLAVVELTDKPTRRWTVRFY